LEEWKARRREEMIEQNQTWKQKRFWIIQGNFEQREKFSRASFELTLLCGIECVIPEHED
jgi:hypothetical protein